MRVQGRLRAPGSYGIFLLHLAILVVPHRLALVISVICWCVRLFQVLVFSLGALFIVQLVGNNGVLLMGSCPRRLNDKDMIHHCLLIPVRPIVSLLCKILYVYGLSEALPIRGPLVWTSFNHMVKRGTIRHGKALGTVPGFFRAAS